ncbi:MAG TPA: hypothetical protein VGL56_05315 [Fimbriimonadaceae bacterium]|jgi:hypothetical protein
MKRVAFQMFRYLTLLTIAATSQLSLSQARPDLPPYLPQRIYGKRTAIQWVFLGWGDSIKTPRFFEEHRISYMELPWISPPNQYSLEVPDTKEFGQMSISAYLVEASQYLADRELLRKSESPETHFHLVRFESNPPIIFPGPPDAELRQRFLRFQPLLEGMIKIARQNPNLVEVPAEGLTADQRSPGAEKQINDLLARSGALHLSSLFAGGYELPCWEFGNSVNDFIPRYAKGFAYLLKPPKNGVKGLDRFAPKHSKRVVEYSHIRGSWYLFVDFIP